jgi:thiamine monophosphate synthase
MIQRAKPYYKKLFIFLDNINELIKINILKQHNVSIIFSKKQFDNSNFEIIKKFCKKNKIELYILDNFKLAIKHKLNGVVISHTNREIIYYGNLLSKARKFNIIGKVHNQLDYYFKQRQGCKTVIFSPIFLNEKYSLNSVRGVLKFNLISMKWALDVCPLGGINLKNYKKVLLTNNQSFAIKSFITKHQKEVKKIYLFNQNKFL